VFFKYIKDNLIYFLIAPLSVYVLLTALLINNNESLISDVSITLYLFVALFSIAPVVIMTIFGRKFKSITLSVIVFLFVYAMYFDNAPIFFDMAYGKLLSAIIIFLAIHTIVERSGDDFGRILVVIFLIFIVSTILTPLMSEDLLEFSDDTGLNSDNKFNNQLPNYIHIILDEHIGIEGMKVDSAERKDYVDQLISSYVENNFHVFGRAYSAFDKTIHSIPSFLNFSSVNNDHNTKYKSGEKIQENKLFDNLNNKGYVFNIYENDFIDLCNFEKYEINKCTKYRTDILFLPEEGKKNKVLSVLRYLAERYRISILWYKLALSNFGKFFNIPPYNIVDRYGAPSLNILDQLTFDVISSKGGGAFVAHLLMPHAPFVYNLSCEKKVQLKDNDRSYSSYIMQVQCIQSKIFEFIKLLKSNHYLENSIIIIQGDHGSRLTNYIKSGLDYDTIDLHSTFFAVHLPRAKVGNYNLKPANVSDILKVIHDDLYGDLSITGNIESNLDIFSSKVDGILKRKTMLPFNNGELTKTWNK
jgi:hypothetical protein